MEEITTGGGSTSNDVESTILMSNQDDENTKNDGTDTPEVPEKSEEIPLCISEEKLEMLVVQILGKVNERISSRIINTITESSDNKHVPSALAVFNFLRTVTPGMTCQTVTGSIESVTDPDTRTIYLQKDDEDDPTWVMYLYVNDELVPIGDTSIDLVNYWSKSESDIAELRTQILNEIGIDIIKNKLDYAYLLKNDSPTKELVLRWIDESSKIVENSMESIISAVMMETDKVYVRKDDFKEQLDATLTIITDEQIASAVDAAFIKTDPAI